MVSRLKGQRFGDHIDRLSVEERIRLAKDIVQKLTHRVDRAIQRSENNKILVYSDMLSSQIPKSRAGHAYIELRRSLFEYEIVRLLALWDRPSSNAVSIPTAIALINSGEVLERLALEEKDRHSGGLSHEGQDYHWPNSRHDLCLKELTIAIGEADRIRTSDKSTALRNLRDHLSHSLDKTDRELSGPIDAPVFGDEATLLTETAGLVETLYCFVNGTSYNLEVETRRLCRDRAEELFLNCKITIPDLR